MSGRLLTKKASFQYSKWLYDRFSQEQRPFQEFTDEQIDQFKRKHIDTLYPYKKVVKDDELQYEKYGIGEIYCQLSQGSFFMGKSTQPCKIYESFGVGTCLYVKSVKHMATFFLFITIMSIMATCLCYWVALCNGLRPEDDYDVFFMSGTVGSLGLEYYRCAFSPIKGGRAQFDLKCPVGTVHMFGLQQSSRNLNSIQNCRREFQQFNYGKGPNVIEPNNFNSVTTCDNERGRCRISITGVPSMQKQYLVYSFECLGAIYSSQGIEIPRKSLFLLLVAFDMIFTLSFMLFIWSQFSSEQQQHEYFKKRQVSLPDFAIKVLGFEWKTYQEDLQNFMNELINVTGDNEFLFNVAEVTIPDSQEFRKYQQLRDKQYGALRNLIELYFMKKQKSPHTSPTAADFQRDHFYSQQDFMNYRRNLTALVQNFETSKYNRVNVKAWGKSQPVQLYLVLKTTKAKSKLLQRVRAMNQSNIVTVKDKTYTLGQPPCPDLILWENLHLNTISRTISGWIATVVLILVTYVLFGYIYDLRNDYLKQYDFDVDCKLLFRQPQLDALNTDLLQNSKHYLHCYCIQRYAVILTDKSNRMLCTDWLHQYWVFVSIPWLISVGLVLYSLAISEIFRFITRLEGHKNLSRENFSFTLKRSLILIINLDLVIVILNFHAKSNQWSNAFDFLLKGQYTQITPDWYLRVGIIVVLTMLFNVFFPFLEFFLMLGLKFLRILWDTRMFRKKTSAKTKQQYMDFYNYDIFPIEERYAQIIAILVICVSFNSVIPILNIIAALSLVIIYISDKLLMFLLFQKNHMFDERLHRIMCVVLYLVLLIHLIVTPFLLSEPSLYSAGKDADDASEQNLQDRWGTIFSTSYTIIYMVLFIIMSILPILKFTSPYWLHKCGIVQAKQDAKLEKVYDIQNVLNNIQTKKLLVAINAQRSKFQCLRNLSCLQDDKGTAFRMIDYDDNNNSNGARIEGMIEQNYQQVKELDERIIDWQLVPELFGLPAYDERAKKYYVNEKMPMTELDNMLSKSLAQSIK